VLSAAIYTVCATLLYGGGSWFATTRIPECACDDQVQHVWFLSWPVYALAHGHNLFYSGWIDQPTGMNLSINTSMPLLGILGAPVTVLLGPVATYNALLRLGFALSALAMCLVLRRWTRWWPAAFVGGLVYGFSPYMVGHGLGHLNLVFVPLPPLILLTLHEIVVRRRRPAWRAGLVLGVLAVAQYLISPEILLLTAISGGIALLLSAAARHREVPGAARHVAAALATAVAFTGVLVAYPVWVGIGGPQHVIGPPNLLRTLALYPGDVLGAVVPTELLHVGPSHLVAVGDRLSGGSLSENGMYLGIPLLVTLAAFTIAFRRRSILVLCVAVGACTWLLSLGPRLTVDRHTTAVRLPFDALYHLPFVQDMLPIRFSLMTVLFAAGAFAVGLDMLRDRIAGGPAAVASGTGPAHRSRRPRTRAHRLAGSAVAVLVAVVVCGSLLPRAPYPMVPTDTPSLFTSPAVDRIPAGSVVLTYPYPVDPVLQGMLDQSVAGMRFKITGGYGFIPGPDGTSIFGPRTLEPPQLQELFYAAYAGGPTEAAELPPYPSSLPAIRSYLTTYGISTVVLHRAGADPGVVVRYLTPLLGAPTHVGGVTEWFDVPARLRAVAAAGG
jgi:hypothetical protein